MSVGLITGGGGLCDRIKNDYYATPTHATELFLNHHPLNNGDSILEPACGSGHISKVLERYYPDSEITSTDLIYRGFGTGGGRLSYI